MHGSIWWVFEGNIPDDFLYLDKVALITDHKSTIQLRTQYASHENNGRLGKPSKKKKCNNYDARSLKKIGCE